MSEGSRTSLAVCVHERVACVRVTGQAKFTSATDFKKLLLQLQADGCQEIVLDLAECTLMDSTFLGVMTGAARRSEVSQLEGRLCVLKLSHPTERVLESLENLGVLKLFTLENDGPSFTGFKRIEDGKVTRGELTRTCLEAHETLMETNAENERRFKDAAEYFRQNLDQEEKKQ